MFYVYLFIQKDGIFRTLTANETNFPNIPQIRYIFGW